MKRLSRNSRSFWDNDVILAGIDIVRICKAKYAILKKAIKAQPENIHAIRMLGMAGEEDEQGYYLEKLESKLTDPQISDDDATLINFALYEICNKNRYLKKLLNTYWMETMAESCATLTMCKWTNSFLRTYIRFSDPLNLKDTNFDQLDHTPIFIVGMMRSGTT